MNMDTNKNLFMFDTNCFHKIKDVFVEKLNMDGNLYFITDIQLRELKESLEKRMVKNTLTRDGKKRILNNFFAINKKKHFLETGLLGHPEAGVLGSMKLGSTDWYELFLKELNLIKKEKNNVEDSLIAEVAVYNSIIFVTIEKKLINVINRFIPKGAISFENFKKNNLLMLQQDEFKQSKIGIIPEDWEIKNFKDVMDIIDCSHSKKPSFVKNSKYIYLELDNIKDSGFLDLSLVKYVSKKDYIAWTKRLVPRVNDIVITKTGRVGVSAIIFDNFNICIGRNQVILRTNNSFLNSHYLWHYLRSNIFKNELKKNTMTGTILDSLHVKNISKLKIVLPNLKVQQKISAFLDAISYKIELLQEQNKTLEKIGQTIFKHWFVDFEFPNKEGKPYKSSGGEMIYNKELKKEIPKDWTVSKMGSKLETVLGGTPNRHRKEYWINGTINWINSGKVNEFRILEPTELITQSALNSSATKLLPKGTVVIAITGATLGQVSLLEIDSCANQSVVGILESNELKKSYIYFLINHLIGHIISRKTGGAQQHINKNNINNIYFIIPSNNILNLYYNFVDNIMDLISNNCFSILSLEKTRDLLLPKLMTGKIRVKL